MSFNCEFKSVFPLIRDCVADAIIANGDQIRKSNTPQPNVLTKRQDDTKQINRVFDSFDTREQDALAARFHRPDESEEIAYVPRDIAKQFAIAL